MRDFLRFFLSAADEARVDAASITVSDVSSPYVRNGLLFGNQSLKITFRITNPAAGAPALRPLFPGSTKFLAQAGAPGTLPEPAAINLTAADVPTWRTLGTLQVKAVAKDVVAGLAEHGPGLEVQPTVAWYSPIRLSETFMLTTLLTSLAKANVGTGTAAVKPANADWPKHAASGFLKGTYTPELRLGPATADDDVAKFAMPTVEMNAAGNVELFITIARSQEPHDGVAADMDALAPGVTRDDPEHPINGLAPARHVYRTLRPRMIDAAAGSAVPDTVLAAWPQAPRHHAVSVTRTWKPVANFSIHFPRRTLHVAIGGGAAVQLPIPAHGVVYVPQAPVVPDPGLPVLRISNVSGQGLVTTFMDGRTADAWKVKAPSTAFDVNLATPGTHAHVIMRRPLKEEMLADRVFPRPGGMRCTYMSLRRATRAFVDHRLTGGRLVKETTTTATTRQLMVDAWSAASAGILVNGRPSPSASPGVARQLEPIWVRFFPDIVPAQVIDNTGSPARNAPGFTGGAMFYTLWQTIEDVLRANGTKRNFSNDHAGKGAPGAIAGIGLATGYLVDPPHANPAPAVLDTIVDEMLDGRLTPGCVLQFWDLRTDYERIRTRSATAVSSYGHSPIFLKYMPPAGGRPGGIVVIDQFGGNSQCPLTAAGRLNWQGGGDGEQIWIAAQWDD